MTEAEILKYIVTKQFNKTDDEVAALLYEGDALKDNAGDLILQLNEEKIARLNKEKTDNFDKGYKKAQKEVLTTAEKKFKELTGFDGEADDFDTLITNYLADSEKKVKTKPITEDEVKKHPLFVQLETSRIPKDEYEKLNKEFEDFKNNVSRNAKLGQIKSKAWEIVAAKNPILPQSQQIATTLRQKFLDELNQFDYEGDNGSVLVVKEGKRLEDQHGNPKAFESVVTELAGNFFEFQAQGDKGNAGNGGGGNANVNLMPKTAADLNKVFAQHPSQSKEDMEARVAASKYYQANKID